MDRAISAQSDALWEQTVVAAYEQHARILWEYARRLGRDHDGADDAVQEAFARLLHQAAARRPDNIGGWLYRAIHNLVMDEHRRGRRIATRPVQDLGDHPSLDDPDAAERIAIWDAVDRLPARQREVIFLRYRAGLDFASIGSITGTGESGRLPGDAVTQEVGRVMDLDLEARIERALARGHPETDGYLRGGLDLSRRPTPSHEHRRSIMPALAAAAVVAVAIAFASVQFDGVRPGATSAGGLGAQGYSSPSPSASNMPALELEIVKEPSSELMADVSARGSQCFAMSTHYRIPPNPVELDEQIKEAGIVQGWLIVGSRWVGSDRVALAQAFGATRAVAADPDGSMVWILTERQGRLGQVELLATKTPGGYLVWDSGNSTFEADCVVETPPPVWIEVVEDPREVAMQEMVNRGSRCFQGSDILTVAPDTDLLDRQIRDAGIDVGWLQSGSRWVGEDPTPMVLALGSDFAVAGPDERHLWTIVSRNGTLSSREYRAVTTPNGHWVWMRGDTDQAIPC